MILLLHFFKERERLFSSASVKRGLFSLAASHSFQFNFYLAPSLAVLCLISLALAKIISSSHSALVIMYYSYCASLIKKQLPCAKLSRDSFHRWVHLPMFKGRLSLCIFPANLPSHFCSPQISRQSGQVQRGRICVQILEGNPLHWSATRPTSAPHPSALSSCPILTSASIFFYFQKATYCLFLLSEGMSECLTS